MPLSRSRPSPADPVVALGLAAAGCVAGAYYRPPGWHAFDGTGPVLACPTALPLAVRRRLPGATVPASAAAYAVYPGCGHQPSVNVWTPVVGLLSLAGCRPLAVAWAGGVPVAAVTALSGLAGHPHLALVAARAVLVVRDDGGPAAPPPPAPPDFRTRVPGASRDPGPGYRDDRD
ncbi:hypothetical protein ABTY20_05040 [Streptomyces sp. NPDC126497]|uniref:hypothetical protein n=1 Tax=Streptomyces sp. NPDC126497 TaxID=3155313 RepID=UPI003324D202